MKPVWLILPGGNFMEINRRHFLKLSGLTATSAVMGSKTSLASTEQGNLDGQVGCLVDTTLCVGCRKCEEACNQRHSLPRPDDSFEELTVLENERRMDETSYTVVNKYYPKDIGTLTWRQRPSFVKFQCMHCNDPSCVSACIVGALTKASNGCRGVRCEKVYRLPLLYGGLPFSGTGLRI